MLAPSDLPPLFVAATQGCPCHCVAQEERLPLHYAAENSATLDVVKLLLGPDESNAAAAADTARRCASTTATSPRPQLPPVLHPSPSLLLDALAEALRRAPFHYI